MNAQQLRELQAPSKQKYRDTPGAARQTLAATGELAGDGIVCRVNTFAGPIDAGLHPATGGDGSFACSAEMLLEALVGCAGVTLRAVATALEIPLAGAKITAEGDLDFRGTLGVAKDAPVGLTSIRLTFDLDSDAPDEQLTKLLSLVERYCVVYQTLRTPPAISTNWQKA
jgi:uncharacterized OsmC-like protein